MVEHHGDLFAGGGGQRVGAVGVRGVVRGVAGGVELPALLRLAAVREGALAARRRRAWHSIFWNIAHIA